MYYNKIHQWRIHSNAKEGFIMKKQFVASAVACMLLIGSNAMAAEIHESQVQDNLVNRIRNAEMEAQPQQDNIKTRIAELLKENNKDAVIEQKSTLPKVVVMYVNNAKSTYDDEVDKEIFKYLNQAMPEDVYELVDGAPYMEKLNKMGYMDISMAERADIIAAFEGEDIDYCLYLEIQPFVARDKISFFSVGKDVTTAIPFKLINMGTGRYIFNGTFTEKASDSSMIGGIGNKSVALKAIDSAGEKILSEIQVRLPKTKSVNQGE